jgi:CRP-like cAMP-binding protein
MSEMLGKVYEDGEIIINQGEVGDCMYIIQEGEVEIISAVEGGEIVLAVRGEGEFVGEMSIFDREVRSASVRSRGRARLLTVDKRNFMSRVHEDPSIALRLVQMMSSRIRELSREVARLKGAG